MIEIFLEAPLELKVIILSVLTIGVYEFLNGEVSSWNKQQSKRTQILVQNYSSCLISISLLYTYIYIYIYMYIYVYP